MKAFAISLFFIFFIPSAVFANPLNFSFIYPEGEGDNQTAQPYLKSFFEKIKENGGPELTGNYFNDADDAQEALEEGQIDFAIVEPLFFERFSKKLKLRPLLKAVPSYSNGAFEKYYIMAFKDTDVTELEKPGIAVNLFASREYNENFLNNQIFKNNDQIKKVPWYSRQTENLLKILKEIDAGKNNTFVLLTGYEFTVINKIKKQGKDFQNLKLVYTSPELPSSVLVIGKDVPKEQQESLSNALQQMSSSLTGQIALKKLRLKGFTHY
ncbi:MAG: PhnD/SsuA/transferrin family substrate-binding protein [Deltaproteobacteria bacterium]|nr:PhnD/SsuA/transferrin family substrate-binding protein [Deltaproteobacteria bacterium]